MIISYKTDINNINIADATYKIISFDLNNEMTQESKEGLVKALSLFVKDNSTYDRLGHRIPWRERKDKIKIYKKISGKIRDHYIKNGYLQTLANIIVPNERNNNEWEVMSNIYKCFKDILNEKSLNIIIPTICRLYEFYYLSHDELKREKANMIHNMDINSEEPINMRDLKESVYKNPDIFSNYDHLTNIKNYKKDYTDYMKSKGIEPSVDLDEYTSSLNYIFKLIREFSYIGIESDMDSRLPFRELFPFIILYENREEFSKILLDYKNGKYQDNSIKTKDSGSVYNSDENFRQYMERKYGLHRISNIEGNWIAAKSDLIDSEALYKYNFLVEYNPLFRGDLNYIDYGLGDGYKLRVVGQTCTMHQAGLSPLTSLYKKKIAGNSQLTDRNGSQFKSLCVATYDIMGRLDLIGKCDHAVSLDYTGYSDYMARSLLYMMFVLCEWDPIAVQLLIDIFSLPLCVDGHIFPILFGTLQGVEFDFSAITLANVFFSLQAKVIYMFRNKVILSEITSIAQGDDKIIISFNGNIPQEFINLNMELAIMSNCVINPDKTEDSNETGNYVFCKVRKTLNNEAVSGLSGNLILKQTKFLSDISGIISQMRKVGYNLLIEQEENIIKYLLERSKDNIRGVHRSLSKVNNKVFNDIIDLAYEIPIEAGGLNCKTLNTKHYLAITKGALENALKDSFKTSIKTINRVERFAILGGLMEVNGILNKKIVNRRYSNLVETAFSSGREIMTLLESCNMMLKSAIIDVKDFKEYKSELRKIFNLIYKTMSNSNAISTKDRVDPTKNQDLLLVKGLGFLTNDNPEDKDSEIINKFFDSEDDIYTQIRYLFISDIDIQAETDLPLYKDIATILEYYCSSIRPCTYSFPGGEYQGIKFKGGKLDGKLLRLEGKNDWYNNKKTGWYDFLTPGDMDNCDHYWILRTFFEKKVNNGDIDLYFRIGERNKGFIDRKIIGKIIERIKLKSENKENS